MSVRFYAIYAYPTARRVAELAEFTGNAPESSGLFQWFERPDALPRAYAVREVRAAADLDAARRLVASAEFRPREEAVIQGEAPHGLVAGAGGDPDRAEIAAYAPDEVAIDVECGARCLAVLTDLHYPGWTATVDAEPRPVLRVNGIFRGVWLPAGRHRITYRYRPASLRAGVACLAAAVLVFGAAAALERRRAPDRAAPPRWNPPP